MTLRNIFSIGLFVCHLAISSAQETKLPQEIGWINEFHYRNKGKDRHLFIEVAGPKFQEAWEYFIVMYQGRDGLQFKDAGSLSGYTFLDGGPGAGAPEHGFIDYPIEHHGDIRNGKHGGDALALVYRFDCIQFLCYGDNDTETFTAQSGPCHGHTCVNIGVHEGHHNSWDHSLQMIGTGNQMANFTWAPTPLPKTPGKRNEQQEFTQIHP